VGVPLNPRNLDSELYRSQLSVIGGILRLLVLYPPVKGAYTPLFRGLSPEVRIKRNRD
jgi:retinol dehydrogenase 12